MKLIAKLRDALFQHDPYGLLRVGATQAVFVTIGLFLINFAFALPHFNTVYVVPAIGFMVIAFEPSFNLRLRNMAIFCLIVLVYTLLLSLVQNYRYLLVGVAGGVIFTLFILSRKYNHLLMMIPIVHGIGYGFLIIRGGGDFYKLYVFSLSYLAILACTLSLMLFFPRIYFFRIWLRSFHLTLHEFEQKLHEMIAGKAEEKPYIHLIAMQDFSHALSYQEYGFSARKIGLRCMSFYTFTLAVIYGYQNATKRELINLAHIFAQLQQVIPHYEPLNNVSMPTSTNPQMMILHRKLFRTIAEWNKLCQKL